MKKVLFLCTGNYYRSRFAEMYFNHLAAQNNLDWLADSRGLAVESGHKNIGNISPFALARLEALQISVPLPHRASLQVTIADLESSDLIIAMYDSEHRPFVKTRFPAWLDRIEFWRVADIYEVSPDAALPQIQKQTEDLIERLKTETDKKQTPTR